MSLDAIKTEPGLSLPAPVPGVSAIRRLRESGDERRGFVPLDRNERLAELPEAVVEELRAGMSSEVVTEYPVLDSVYADLVMATGVPRDRLVLTSGSDAAFKALHQCYVSPGDRVVALHPSYAMYAVYAEMFQARLEAVPFALDLSLDVDRLVDAISTETRLVLLANPNQPTGTVLPERELIRVLERAAQVAALVIVDEAYYPFSRFTALPRLADHPNLVVTRTFSKAWGLAGARVGFAAAHPEVIGTLARVRSVYDITGLSAHCVRVVLRHPEVADEYVASVDAGRRLLAERARELDLEPLECPTNFLPIRVAQRVEPRELVDALHERGYLVKGPFAAACLRDCIRVTLGPPELMATFAAALADALQR